VTSEGILLEKIKILPPNLKQEAIHLVEFLETKLTHNTKRKSMKGALSHLNIRVSDEDIRGARNEMWRRYI
jgi:hypothetical protein